MHLHPGLDTVHDPKLLTPRTRHRTRSQTIYTLLYPHTILTYFIHLSYSQNPNSRHPPTYNIHTILVFHISCRRQAVFLLSFTTILSHTFRACADPSDCIAHGNMKLPTQTCAEETMTNLYRAVFELAIQALRRPRQDNDVTTIRRAMTPAHCLPCLCHFKTKHNRPWKWWYLNPLICPILRHRF